VTSKEKHVCLIPIKVLAIAMSWVQIPGDAIRKYYYVQKYQSNA